MHVCLSLQVSVRAEAKQRKSWMGILYDSLARKSWAEKAANNEVRRCSVLHFTFMYCIGALTGRV